MRPLKRYNSRLWLLASLIAASCSNEPAPPAAPPAPPDNSAASSGIPAVLSWDIVKEYPHDPMAFTEGLEFRDGSFYESTGQYGSSDLRVAELVTGKVLRSKKMEAKYFGEGLTILNGKVYQLTYREGKGFVYDLATLKQERTFTIDAQEGWGMTNDGTHLIYDDGSNLLHYIDPATFKEVKRIAVMDEHGPVNEINELEMIDGYIYANQWQTELILKIDTATGRVVARADLGILRQRAGIPSPSGRPDAPDVLNGIAHDAATGRIFITGKYWPKLFEIKLGS